MIRLQTAHARGSTSSAVTLRRHQIMLQRCVVESQRCLPTPVDVRLQPNHYRPRRRRARRQILSSLLPQTAETPQDGFQMLMSRDVTGIMGFQTSILQNL